MKVLFSASNKIGGYLIRLGTKSSWCHVDLLFDDGTLIGATGKGVQKLTLQERLADKHIFRYRIDEIPLPYEESARLFAEQQVGKPYDYTAVFAFALPFRENWNQDNKWFCSELAAATIGRGGTQIAREEQWRITPGYLDTSPLLKTIPSEELTKLVKI
jgi:uncharacterized protein YycO